jgi:hypothetical protein
MGHSAHPWFYKRQDAKSSRRKSLARMRRPTLTCLAIEPLEERRMLPS